MKAAELKIAGIKCNTPGCGYRDDTVQVKDYKLWVNKPCPKCGASLLTQADYSTTLLLIIIADAVNSFFQPITYLLNLIFHKNKRRIVLKGSMNGTGKITFKEKK
jgi:hypothetical protein